MDKTLIESIEETVSREKLQCDFITGDQAAELVKTLAIKFSFDLNRLFVWSNKDFGEVHSYKQDSNNWELLMQGLLNKFNAQLFVAITDEEFFPWNVLKCRKQDFIKLLKEQRYFEYFIFDASMSCVLFDTHDNSLILFYSITGI